MKITREFAPAIITSTISGQRWKYVTGSIHFESTTAIRWFMFDDDPKYFSL